MRKALAPVLVLVALIVALAAAVYFYDQHWGAAGPFPPQPHHGDDGHGH